MTQNKKIEERAKVLAEKEAKIKMQLDTDSDELKEKAVRIGKIAAITGIVALVGYWIFNVFSDTETEEEEEPKTKKVPQRASTTSRIVTVLMPYLNRFLDGILEDEGKEVNKKEEN